MEELQISRHLWDSVLAERPYQSCLCPSQALLACPLIRERLQQWISAAEVQAADRTGDMCACHYILASGSLQP